MDILVFPYRDDNYGFLIHDPMTGQTAAIDAGDDATYLDALAKNGWTLSHMLITHHHFDHTSHLEALKSATKAQVWGPAGIAGVDQVLVEGDSVEFGEHAFQVMATPGHTLDMLNFYLPSASALFSGDTLFTLGCGRLFEGTHAQMWTSLQKLMALPTDTLVYGAHEYTAANLAFAESHLPGHKALSQRAALLRKVIATGQPTVPTQLGEEMATNPFLLANNVEEFRAARVAKDQF